MRIRTNAVAAERLASRRRLGLASVCVNGVDAAGDACFSVDAQDCLLPLASAGDGLPCLSRAFPWVGIADQDCCKTGGWVTLLAAGLAGFLAVRLVSR
jgi:hypothetical protein